MREKREGPAAATTALHTVAEGMEPGPGDLDWETLATKGGVSTSCLRWLSFLVHEVLGEGEAENPGISRGWDVPEGCSPMGCC